MRNRILVMAITVIMSSCGGGDLENPAVDEIELGAANPSGADVVQNPYSEAALEASPNANSESANSESAALNVSADFNLGTSRQKIVSVNLGLPSSLNATFLICTDFEAQESGYKVDYSSCPLRARLNNGTFQDSVLIMNQYDRVLGIVWSDLVDVPPMFKEFRLDDESSVEAEMLNWS